MVSAFDAVAIIGLYLWNNCLMKGEGHTERRTITMSTFIFLLVFFYIIGSIGDSSSKKSSSKRQPSRREIKRARKARERAEMDAYEDMLMYLEAWY